jgi:serine/threonine protein kinase
MFGKFFCYFIFCLKVHRDIKPENFLIGRGEKEDILYMIDLGLTKAYIDPGTKKHIPYTTKHGVVGTLRYISVV